MLTVWKIVCPAFSATSDLNTTDRAGLMYHATRDADRLIDVDHLVKTNRVGLRYHASHDAVFGDNALHGDARVRNSLGEPIDSRLHAGPSPDPRETEDAIIDFLLGPQEESSKQVKEEPQIVVALPSPRPPLSFVREYAQNLVDSMRGQQIFFFPTLTQTLLSKHS